MKNTHLPIIAAFLGALVFSGNSYADFSVADTSSAPDVINNDAPPSTSELLITQNSPASASETTLYPAAYLSGYGGKNLVGNVQGLWPFTGNNLNDLFYGIVEASDASGSTDGISNGWAAGGGFGYRHVFHDAYILGGYLIADYNRTPSKNNFVIANPGFEFLTGTMDARINGYIPMGGRNNWYSNDQWGDTVNHYEFVQYTGHQELDHQFNWLEQTGPGADAEVGAAIPHLFGLKAYVGGYYFNLNRTGNVEGPEARLVFPVKNYLSLEVRGSHDSNQGTIILGGIRINIGGLGSDARSQVSDVTARIIDPVEHNFAAFSLGNSVPIKNQYIDTGRTGVEQSNIWFFNAGAAADGNGTAESPYKTFNSTKISMITGSNPNLYFATGTYDMSGIVQLPAGFSMYGRNAGWLQSARVATLVGEIDINQGRNTIDSITLNDVALSNDIGIKITNAYNVTLNNDKIGSGTNNPGTDYATALSLNNAMGITINNSVISAYSYNSNATAISMQNINLLTLGSNNTIYANVEGSHICYGINTSNLSTGTRIVINAGNNFTIGYSSEGATASYGIYSSDAINAASSANLVVNQTQFNIYNTHAPSAVYGIYSSGGYAPSYQNALIANNYFSSNISNPVS